MITTRYGWWWLATALLVLLVSGCGPGCWRHGCDMEDCRKRMTQQGVAPAAAAEVRTDVLYTCNCGPDCHCNSVSTTPGNCTCGKPLAWGHLVRVEGDEALLCTCKEGCKCQIDPQDKTRCGCGNPIKHVSLKGTGLYFCNCGGACACNTVSAQPGTCRCGMPLKTVP